MKNVSMENLRNLRNNNEKIVKKEKGGESNYSTQNALSLLDRSRAL